jgi:hypothetical protein
VARNGKEWQGMARNGKNEVRKERKNQKGEISRIFKNLAVI